MDKLEYQKKAKILTALLLIILVPLYLYSGFRAFNDYYSHASVAWYSIFIFILIIVFFYPLLLRIHKYAQLGNMNNLAKISKIFIFLLRGIIILAPVATLFTYVLL